MSVHPPTSATHRPPPLVAAAETQSGAVLAFAYFISVRSTSYRPQDFPTLRLIFRSADERRPDRDVLTGFRGCEAARVPTAAAFPAPDDSFSMSGGFPADPGRLGVSGPGQGGDGLSAVQLQPAPGFGQALRLAAVGEDHRERDVVGHGPVRRPVARAGQAGVLAADAVSRMLRESERNRNAHARVQRMHAPRQAESNEIKRGKALSRKAGL